MVQPCGLANQFTLTETGERAPKARLTQDFFSFYNSRRCRSQQKSRDERIPRYGLWMVPVTSYSLHRGPTVGVSQRENTHREIRLLGRLPKSSSLSLSGGPTYHRLRKRCIHSPSPFVRRIPKPTDLVRTIGNDYGLEQ